MAPISRSTTASRRELNKVSARSRVENSTRPRRRCVRTDDVCARCRIDRRFIGSSSRSIPMCFVAWCLPSSSTASRSRLPRPAPRPADGQGQSHRRVDAQAPRATARGGPQNTREPRESARPRRGSVAMRSKGRLPPPLRQASPRRRARAPLRPRHGCTRSMGQQARSIPA
jgi:hypothetical protein